jgi:hypothetical protein
MTDRVRVSFGSISEAIDRTSLDLEEKNRLKHYSVYLVIGLPTMAAFAIYNGFSGKPLIAGVVLTSVVGLAGGWLLLMRGLRPRIVYRSNALFFWGVVVYIAGAGGNDGAMILWSYTFPPIAFMFLGCREGLVWAALHYLLTAAIVLGATAGLPTHVYPPAIQSRFLVTMALVGATSFWFEYFRQQHRRLLEGKNAELEEALDQVQTLRGLLPICSSCKKIRDEGDRWHDLESYFQERAETRFSHGICPDCARTLYGEDISGVSRSSSRETWDGTSR